MNALYRVLTGLAIGYGAMVLLVFVFQRSMMYFPAQDLRPPAAYGVGMFEVVNLETADGLTLTSWYAPAAAGKATLVHYHGNGGHIAHRLDRMMPLVKAGYGVLLTEYRGYGGNPGKPTEPGLYADGRAALKFLAARGISGKNLVIVGESLGSGVAVKMAEEVETLGLILESPFTSAADIGQAAYFFLPVRLLMWDRFDSIDRIAEIAAPLLIIHGERDNVVPVRFGKRLFAKAVEPKQLELLPKAGHNNINHHGSTKIELEFLGNLTAQSD